MHPAGQLIKISRLSKFAAVPSGLEISLEILLFVRLIFPASR